MSRGRRATPATVRRSRLGQLFRRANRWQKAIAVVCAVVAVHGVYVVFVPPVPLVGSDLQCPPAVVAALAGSGGVETVDGSAEVAARHDAACAATGRRWLVAGLLQVGLASVWGLATLEWARVWRRVRRRRRRQLRAADGSRAPGNPGPR